MMRSPILWGRSLPILMDQIRIGIPIDQALGKRMYERIPVQEVNFFGIVIISIQSKTGGNLAEALTQFVYWSLRERKKAVRTRFWPSVRKQSHRLQLLGPCPLL